MLKAKEEAARLQQAASLKCVTHTNPKNLGRQSLDVLSWLRCRPMTSVDLYQLADVLHPPARIRDLRDAGYVIITYWSFVATHTGALHHVGRYVLLAEPAKPSGGDGDDWEHISEPLKRLLSDTPEKRSGNERKRDLRNWHLALKKCNPLFAKRFITGRLRDTGAVDDDGITWLLTQLDLVGV